MMIDALKGTTPWFVSGAIDYLAERIQPEWSVFEWGCGGSTLWFAQRAFGVTAVEHDVTWAEKTRSELAQFGLGNAIICHVPKEYGQHDYDQYAAFITTFAGECDLISVDGRNRAECLTYAKSKLKSGGLLVLDNSERIEYQDAMRQFDGWERHDFGPGNSEGWTTTVWVKPV